LAQPEAGEPVLIRPRQLQCQGKECGQSLIDAVYRRGSTLRYVPDDWSTCG